MKPFATRMQTFLLFLTFFSAASLAQAADWSNGEIGCSVRILSVGSYFESGIWTKIQVNFFAEADPETSLEYVCKRNPMDSSKSQFNCELSLNHKQKYTLGGDKNCYLVLEPGKATPKKTCEQMFPLLRLSLVPY